MSRSALTRSSGALQLLSGIAMMALSLPLWLVTRHFVPEVFGLAVANWFWVLLPTGSLVAGGGFLTMVAPNLLGSAGLFALGIELVAPLFGAIHEPWAGLVVALLRWKGRRRAGTTKQRTVLSCEDTEADTDLSAEQAALIRRAELVRSLVVEASTLTRSGRRSDAVPILERVVDLAEQESPQALALALRNLASVRLRSGLQRLEAADPGAWEDLARSLDAAEHARDVLVSVQADACPMMARVQMLIGSAASALKEHDAARRAYEQALGILSTGTEEDDPSLLRVYTSLAEVSMATGAYAESIAWWRKALRTARRACGPRSMEVPRMVAALARACWANGELDQAHALTTKALQLAARIDPDDALIGALSRQLSHLEPSRWDPVDLPTEESSRA